MRLLTVAFSLLASPAFASVGGQDLLTGQTVEVEAGEKGTVVVFLSARCPCSNAHVETLKDLAKRHGDFKFVAVNANADEPASEAKAYFAKQALPFPVVRDEKAKLADRFKALKTPHAFVLAKSGDVIFQGGVTDSHVAASAHKQYLADALDAIAGGKAPAVANARALGCVIAR